MSIAQLQPSGQFAVVAPRVRFRENGEFFRFVDEFVRHVDHVEKALRRGMIGEYCLFGPAGSGKSTALRELYRTFPDDDRVKLVDDCLTVKSGAGKLVIFTTTKYTSGVRMELAPWSRDEWIEYMLARWRGRCSSVMGRVLNDSFADRLDGNAQLWAAVLDEMAVGPDSLDIRGALRKRVARIAPSAQRHADAAGLCVQLLTHRINQSDFSQTFCRDKSDFAGFLRHRAVQVLLASDVVVHWLCDLGEIKALDGMWPLELIAETAQGLKQRNGIAEILEGALEQSELRLHPVAASLLLALEPSWRPSPRYVPNLCSAQLQKAQWPHVDLFGARLVGADFRSANLQSARLQKAKASNARLARADLREALMEQIDAEGANLSFANMTDVQAKNANFAHANLQASNLESAALYKASFVGAKLNDAHLRGANLRKANFCNARLEGADFSKCDLSQAVFKNPKLQETNLSGAKLQKAWLVGCDMEEMDLRRVDLSGAVLNGGLLTGACLAGANLRKADLQNTGLAEIDLEGADLRKANLHGCSFHLGSTRGGLVGSVIPCEGSKTGFYTDEREEQHFRRPEEIRKANLSRADLRGAKINGVDFYLVDVCGAKYSGRQGKYLKRCGAIMT
jgi:uncharacterized protein YjbI with pentapeptide repeats